MSQAWQQEKHGKRQLQMRLLTKGDRAADEAAGESEVTKNGMLSSGNEHAGSVRESGVRTLTMFSSHDDKRRKRATDDGTQGRHDAGEAAGRSRRKLAGTHPLTPHPAAYNTLGSKAYDPLLLLLQAHQQGAVAL